MKWVFEYTRAEEMSSVPKTIEGWRLLGRKNTEPTLSASMIAHDVFHHDPKDKGTFIEEVRSYGAEMWFVADLTSENIKTIVSNIEPILDKTLEFFPLEKLAVPLYSPARYDPHNYQLWLQIRETVKEGLLNLVQDKEGLYDQEDTKILNQLAHSDMWDSYAHHIMDGYLKAQVRWPDQQKAQQLYKDTEKWFNSLLDRAETPPLGTLIEVTFNGMDFHYNMIESVLLNKRKHRF